MMNNLFEDFPFYLMPEQQKLPRTLEEATATPSPSNQQVENISSSINQDFLCNLSTPLFSHLNTDSGSPLIGDNVSLDASNSLFASTSTCPSSEYINYWFSKQPNFNNLASPNTCFSSNLMDPLSLELSPNQVQAFNGSLSTQLPGAVSSHDVTLFSPTIKQLLAAHQENMKLNLKIRRQLAQELHIHNFIYAPISTPIVDGKDPGSTYLYDIDASILANGKGFPTSLGEPLVPNLTGETKTVSGGLAQFIDLPGLRKVQPKIQPLIDSANPNTEFYSRSLSNLDVLNAANSSFSKDSILKNGSNETELDSDPGASSRSTSSRRQDPNARRFPCEFPGCNLNFTRKFNLKTHEFTHNPDRVKRYECEMCPKRFDRKHDLNRHQGKMHFSLPKYKCPKCELHIKRKPEYRSHVRVCGEED